MPENIGDDRRVDRANSDRGSDLAVAYVASGEMEALTVKSVLEAAGVEAVLRMEAVTRLLAMTIDGLGAVEVLVSREHLDEARAILDTPAEVIDGPGTGTSDGGGS